MEMFQEIIDRIGQAVLWCQPIEGGFSLAQLCGRQSGLNESSRSLGINRLRFLLGLPHQGFGFRFATDSDTLSANVSVYHPRLVLGAVFPAGDLLDRNWHDRRMADLW